MADKQVIYDVDGYDVVSKALMDLINQFPGLQEGMEFSFSSLADDSGLAVYPTSGAIVQSEIKDVTGHIKQTCIYPFTSVYRVNGPSESRKIAISEWLDKFGRWLERQPVQIGETQAVLVDYPPLTGTRRFERIYRVTPASMMASYDDRSEDWGISINAIYVNEYDQ